MLCTISGSDQYRAGVDDALLLSHLARWIDTVLEPGIHPCVWDVYMSRPVKSESVYVYMCICYILV